MNNKLQKFKDEVVLKYHLYNGLFLTLPFTGTEETGSLLSLFTRFCNEEIYKKISPEKILENFFKKNNENDKIENLFKMLQFIERQIVLFDTLEDAAFSDTHDLNGPGSLQHLIVRVENTKNQQTFIKKVADYQIRIVLTAHPTQFYPKSVLTLLPQLIDVFRKNNINPINELLTQMGKTSFTNRQKPTPFQEAKSLIWYLENTLYPVIPKIQSAIDEALLRFGCNELNNPNAVSLGFWPGGDRDGNPFVTSDTTLEVAKLLKIRIIELYLEDLRYLVRKLTFVGVLEKLEQIRNKLHSTYLYATLPSSGITRDEIYLDAGGLLNDLNEIKGLLIKDHNSLSINALTELTTKVRCFGFHFAAMDMREDSSIHREAFKLLCNKLGGAKDKIIKEILEGRIQAPKFDYNTLLHSTAESIRIIKEIQTNNGETGLNRYIISNTQNARDVLELLAMLKLFGDFKTDIPVDVIPLFESIEDLNNALKTMSTLYRDPHYQTHLKHRKNKQTIMVGFSDGTKDGGYVTANWSIYKAKIKLTALSDKYGIDVIFFDGRGGPPGRGGGNTHNFYRSLGSKISHKHPQLTIQGQTIGVTFGTKESSKYNIEQLFTAGIEDLIFPEETHDLKKNEFNLIEKLSEESRKSYLSLKTNPLFVPYLEQITPVKFYGELNIGSRPTTRKKDKKFELSDLRAIPFVGSWSQIKQNIPAYYGFGHALNQLITDGNEKALKQLYKNSLFFRTLTDNAMMGLSKTLFALTEYLKKDPKFGKFWTILNSEAELTKQLVLLISNQKALLENDPINKTSIRIREEIVLPLLIIQQTAMIKLKKIKNRESSEYLTYKKIMMKALTANTNASRNSA
jgi:phosphoenolpyruvate carboxylase